MQGKMRNRVLLKAINKHRGAATKQWCSTRGDVAEVLFFLLNVEAVDGLFDGFVLVLL